MDFETPTPPEVQNIPKQIENPKPDGKTAGIAQGTRERMLTFFEFNKLKLREYFGKIDERQLQSLIELEFEQFKKDTPSISDIFDPEAELQNLRTLPRERKREALTDFKSKLARQREAWATCRTFLRRKIEVNHDVERQDLMDWIDKFSGEYGFTDPQRQTAEEIIDDYYKNRNRIKQMRESHPDNVQLLKVLTDINFSKDTKFDIVVGALGFEIYTDKFTAGRIFEKSEDTIPLKYRGFASKSKDGLLYTVSISRAKDHRQHEDQHQENRLFQQQFDQLHESGNLWSQYKNEQDHDTKRTLLESYLKLKRDEALVRAKDEIIAMKKPNYKGEIYNNFSKKDNSSYDYLSYLRDYEDTDLWKECSQELLVEEYRKIIESAIAAFDQLKKKGRYSTDLTIALLTDKPLTQWSKTARRLIEEDE
jgi:hypothetical protein|tara:strand:+ start:104 stop:1369 length:1266 start_codon:yes stop_codon:yes gene_type:complete